MTTTDSPPPAGEAGADPRRWIVLGVLCVNLVLVVAAVSSANVALPTLTKPETLGASQTELQWIVDAYALVFAGLLFPAGALGDRFGRKGALQAGLAIFGLASLAASMSGSTGQLIGARCVMGVGAALIMPTTLSILTNVFPPHERGRAIAIWAGFAGAGGALGPLIGGFLLTHFWWGSVFLLNVVIASIAMVAGGILIHRSKDPSHSKLDPIGALLSMAGFGGLLYAIIEAPDKGWTSAQTLGGFAVALVALPAFVRYEQRRREPMLDMSLFRIRRFTTGTITITIAFFSLFGMFFILTQYFQYVRGYSALLAGAAQVPNALAMLAVAPRSARIAERVGVRRVVVGGLLLHASGFLLLSFSTETSPYAGILIGLLLIGTGSGLAMAPTTTMIMSAVPLSRAGMGSAVNDTAREVGGAAGIAVLGSVLASQYRSGVTDTVGQLPGALGDAVQRSVGQALGVAEQMGGASGSAVADAARGAFVDAMSVGLRVGALTALVAAAIVARLLPAGTVIPVGPPAAVPAPDPVTAAG